MRYRGQDSEECKGKEQARCSFRECENGCSDECEAENSVAKPNAEACAKNDKSSDDHGYRYIEYETRC